MCYCTDEWVFFFFFDSCEDLGLSEIKPGTTVSDVECGKQVQFTLIAVIIAGIIIAGALIILVILLKLRHKIGRCAGKGLILI